MGKAGTVRGRSVQGDKPEWGPLTDALLGHFMWMFEVRLADGTPLHAYKHIHTRRYLHLDAECRAFVYEAPDRYRRIPLADAIAAVFDLVPARRAVDSEDIAG